MDEKTEEKNIEAPLPTMLGGFSILKQIGKGGMGEVLLGKDPSSGRFVAIKRIRTDMAHHEVLRERFLKEAKITASMFHPAIIPVYSIHESEGELYYVMPYVEGETLKTILRDTVRREKAGDPPHPIGFSIGELLRIFIRICEGLSYCHSMGILHRDLKPENILVANYGQVLIFDWGLAGYIGDPDAPLPELEQYLPFSSQLTRPGKVLGTLSYMPPERVEGKPADQYTDLYSLGVILYQMLTLRMPFQRKSVESYRRTKKHEKLIDALEAAPYRDIPPQLSAIAKRCLAPEKEKRYHSIKELIYDLQRYNSGLPDWIFVQELNVDRKEDWELQENVLLSKLVPITRSTEIMQWHVLMLSKRSFSGNKKIDVALKLGEDSEGIGFLLNSPEPLDREGLEDGYLIWIGSKKSPGIKLYRSHVPIIEISDRYVEEGRKSMIELEKIDQIIRLYIDQEMVLNFHDPLPIVGTHVGLLCKDMEFTLEKFHVSVGSNNAMVGCLSIPDAFFASKNFTEAVSEYERIAESFVGRKEGREAIFRSGITYIEMAKSESLEKNRKALFEKANETFERLHKTPSEPMEYLGKSIVYKKMDDLEEESKCLELGLRKFPKHPLTHLLEERVIFRLHESAKNDRKGVYTFALLTLRFLQHQLGNRETHVVIHNLLSYGEHPPFLITTPQFATLSEKYTHMAAQLAFWLDKPAVLKELAEHEKDALNALYLLKYIEEADNPILRWERTLSMDTAAIIAKEMIDSDLKRTSQFDQLLLQAVLFTGELTIGKEILDRHIEESLQKPASPFFFLNGCLIAKEKGFDLAMEHFRKTPDSLYPPTHSLLAHYLKGSLSSKLPHLFTWEKMALHKQLALFYQSLGDKERALYHSSKTSST
jgi:serine/threonine protein kinase